LQKRLKKSQKKGKSVNLRPLRDRIVVRPIERVKSQVIDVVMSELPNSGEILAVGPGEVDKKGRFIPTL
jgi:co-chaperonin GroES (HSP10)